MPFSPGCSQVLWTTARVKLWTSGYDAAAAMPEANMTIY
jgi:hypothetical protein